MKVFTYFENLPSHQERSQAVDWWKRNWEAEEWVTCVLNEEVARYHPWFPEVDRVIAGYPTVNHPLYERACWLRWLAYSVAARHEPRILAVDVDVFNCGLHLEPCSPSHWPLISLGPSLTPAVSGTTAGFDQFIHAILTQAERGIVRIRGAMHVSDMTLALAMQPAWPVLALCADWRPNLMVDTPLVHAGYETTTQNGHDRERVIREILELTPDPA